LVRGTNFKLSLFLATGIYSVMVLLVFVGVNGLIGSLYLVVDLDTTAGIYLDTVAGTDLDL
jgi:hypothetical protein